MDLDDFRSILETSGVDVWMFIDTAITVASLDCGNDLKHRRDGIVEHLYAATSAPASCLNGHGISSPIKKQNSPPRDKRRASPATPQSLGKDDGEDEEEVDPYGGLFDDEQKKVLEIKEQLEDPNQVLSCRFSFLLLFSNIYFLFDNCLGFRIESIILTYFISLKNQ